MAVVVAVVVAVAVAVVVVAAVAAVAVAVVVLPTDIVDLEDAEGLGTGEVLIVVQQSCRRDGSCGAHVSVSMPKPSMAARPKKTPKTTTSASGYCGAGQRRGARRG